MGACVCGFVREYTFICTWSTLNLMSFKKSGPIHHFLDGVLAEIDTCCKGMAKVGLMTVSIKTVMVHETSQSHTQTSATSCADST